MQPFDRIRFSSVSLSKKKDGKVHSEEKKPTQLVSVPVVCDYCDDKGYTEDRFSGIKNCPNC